jgi:hypothetical protein
MIPRGNSGRDATILQLSLQLNTKIVKTAEN